MHILIKVFVFLQYTENKKNRKFKKIKIRKMAQNEPKWQRSPSFFFVCTSHIFLVKTSELKLIRVQTLFSCLNYARYSLSLPVARLHVFIIFITSFAIFNYSFLIGFLCYMHFIQTISRLRQTFSL